MMKKTNQMKNKIIIWVNDRLNINTVYKHFGYELIIDE